MRKNLLVVLFFLLFQTAAFAAAKPAKDITLDFALNYKINKAGKTSQHDMKNVIRVIGSNWNVAGKFQTTNKDEVVLFLVKLVSQRNNKFTFGLMIIDSDSKNTYITEPKITTMAGLPSQMVITGDGRVITLNALVNLAGKH